MYWHLRSYRQSASCSRLNDSKRLTVAFTFLACFALVLSRGAVLSFSQTSGLFVPYLAQSFLLSY